MKNTWKDLGIKDKLAIGSACAAFAIGWALTICAAFIPILLSEQGTLWVLGQALVYTASVFGVSLYFKSEAVQMKQDINKHIEFMERLQIEREKIRNGIPTDDIPNQDNDKDNE